MNKKIAFIGLAINACFLLSCNNNTAEKQVARTSPAKDQGRREVNSDSTIKFFTVEKKKYISFDTLKFPVPDSFNVTLTNVYNGIYEVKSNALVRRKVLISNNLAFFTTFEDLGKGIRAYLYAFDVSHKSFVRDSSFRRNYLYSAAGIFVIEPRTNRIFAVDKSEWYDAKQQNILPASIYEVRGGYYENIKNVYKVADEVPVDTALLSFFKNSAKVHGRGVFILPNNWSDVK